MAVMLLAIGMAMLIIKPYRMWIHQQVILMIATVKNLWTKELVWRKEQK